MLPSAVKSSLGLVFSISPSKKGSRKPDKDDEQYMLILAPFNKAPKINFGQVKLNECAEKTLIIVNPQEFELKLNVKNSDLNINNMDIVLEKQTNIDFKIKWQPDKADSYKFAIIFEVLNSRLKFIVHAFGVCVEPPKKKTRKVLTVLQPIRPIAMVPSADKIEATIQQPSSNKSTTQPPKVLNQKENRQKPLAPTATKPSQKPTLQKPTFIEMPSMIEQQKHELRRQTVVIASPKLRQQQSLDDYGRTIYHTSCMNLNYEYTETSTVSSTLSTITSCTTSSMLRRSVSETNLTFNVTNGGTFNQDGLLRTPVASTESILNGHVDDSDRTPQLNDFMSTAKTPKPPAGVYEQATNIISETPKLSFTQSLFDEASSINQTQVLSSTTTLAAMESKPQIADTTITHSFQLNATITHHPTKSRLRHFKFNDNLYKDSSDDEYYDLVESLRQRKEREQYELDRLNCVIKCQKWIRMKLFRRHMAKHKSNIIQLQSLARKYLAKKKLAGLKENRRQACVKIQRIWRMYKVRCKLKIYKQLAIKLYLHKRVLILKYNYARITRIMTSIRDLYRLNVERRQKQMELNAANTIKRYWHSYKFHKEMNKYKNAAITIQKWSRSMSDRFKYLQLRRTTVKIQQIYKKKFALKVKSADTIKRYWRVYKFRSKMRIYRESAVKIQRWIRSKHDRFVYLRQKRAIEYVQKAYKHKYARKLEAANTIKRYWHMYKLRKEMKKYRNAAIKIQNWIRSKKDRFKYLRARRAIIHVQHRYKQKYAVKVKAANLIKSYWNTYKTRKNYLKQKESAVKIQRWLRIMKERLRYVKLKRSIVFVQQKYKAYYKIRSMAALKIQHCYRMYKYRQMENDRLKRFNYAATLIQACWRGYKTRKEINLVQLRNIRERLSVYIQRPHVAQYTLGYRIKQSLSVLTSSHSLSMKHVITALMDLQTVTRLSQECCIIFTNSGAISILYDFITKCNRSTPHMDLIKLCLQIFINLAKCVRSAHLVVDSEYSLGILVSLLQAYHTSNAHIFMDVCVLLIILASNKELESMRNELLKESVLKKILLIHHTLERRTNLRFKHQQQQQRHHDLNTTVNATPALNNTTNSNNNVSFTFEPEWCLNNKKIFVGLIEPLGAIQYLLNVLNVKQPDAANQSSCSGSGSTDLFSTYFKTPKKTLSAHIENKVISLSSNKQLDHSVSTTIASTISSAEVKTHSSSTRLPVIKQLTKSVSTTTKSTSTLRASIKPTTTTTTTAVRRLPASASLHSLQEAANDNSQKFTNRLSSISNSSSKTKPSASTTTTTTTAANSGLTRRRIL